MKIVHYQRFLDKFPRRVKTIAYDGDLLSYKVPCPCHDDSTPSLSVSLKSTGGIRIHDFGGCSESDILQALGLKPSDLAPPPDWDGKAPDLELPTSAEPPSRSTRGRTKAPPVPYSLEQIQSMTQYKGNHGHVEHIWIYSSGQIHVKFRFTDGKKSFLWGRPAPEFPGKYYLAGVHVKDVALYDGGTLAHLNKDWGSVLWTAEGEKDIDTLALLHLPAVSNPGSAWSPANVATVVSAAPSEVFVVPDQDPTGTKKARDTMTALFNAGIPVRMVTLKGLWTDLPHGGDVSDYYEHARKQGHDATVIAKALMNHASYMIPYLPSQSEPESPAPPSPENDTPAPDAPNLPIPYRGPSGPALVPKSPTSMDLTPMDEGVFFAEQFFSYIRYCVPLGWMYFDGARWIQSDAVAAGILQHLITDQRNYAAKWRGEAAKNLVQAKAAAAGIEDSKDPKAKAVDAATAEDKAAQKFGKFVLKELMGIGKPAGILAHAAARGFVSVDDLDKDGNQLVTPSGTFNLLTGEQLPNNPNFLATKRTAVSPGPEGEDLWQEFLIHLCSGDVEKVRYLQAVCGMTAFGRVLEEKAILSIGPGGNGKSTFWNTVAYVLGDYAGTIHAETLTTAFRGNSEYELAALRGKRLVLAAELEQGRRMNTAMLKQLVSTDRIHARQIYRDPIDFLPTHTLVLYTNVLPSVSSDDLGTWDRLAVVPLTERFRNTAEEQKDYAARLQAKCGPAILRWIIQGAKAFAEAGYKLPPCQAVLDATKEYRETNDILSEFIEEQCIVDPNLNAPAQKLYDAFRNYCLVRNETAIRQHDFPDSMLRRGFPQTPRSRQGKSYRGLDLRRDPPASKP